MQNQLVWENQVEYKAGSDKEAADVSQEVIFW